jgi:hypothetical protein
MIPKNLNNDHILAAIAEINKNGIPSGRNATKYHLIYKGKAFPPKYVISLANKYANGTVLKSNEFNGGKETNDFLARYEFHVSSKTAPIIMPRENKNEKETKKHDERCSECKNTIIEMFRYLYGQVKVDHKIKVPARIDDYVGKSLHMYLQKILQGLESHRGHKDFIRLRTLRRCDLYVPSINAVVEFDESQHFTQSRKITLSYYPDSLRLGFDLNIWKSLCDNIDAKDNDPIYRDEQRAWYDTIRDFLPIISGFSPTIRMRMGEYHWCSLNPQNPSDVKTFQRMINVPPPINEFRNTRPSDTTQIATIIIQSSGKYPHNSTRKELLNAVLEKLNGLAHAIIFPAGFYKVRKKASNSIDLFADGIKSILSRQKVKTVVCFGIDGRGTKDKIPVDQIAVAVTQAGIVGVGRKFHPTKYEKEITQLANSYTEGDFGYPRIINVKGKKAFLAVCYDGFGIRQKKLANPGIQLVFDLVHRFEPLGEEGSGEVYFAKHGFAGSSRQWKCPVFGAAVFFSREIPRNWPTGVVWNQGNKSTKDWCYKDNPLCPQKEFTIKRANEVAFIRMFSI